MSTVRQKWKYRVIAFGLDGTLLRGPNFDYSWQLVWREQKLPMKLHSQYMENFHDGKWDYTTWCQQVVKKLRSSGLTRDRIATIAAGVSLTKNFHQTVQTLKNEGFSLAIVSGGIDTFIHDAIPDAEKYFDYIFINRATFDSDGLITDVVPTKYDFEGKAEALKYVCRTIGCGEDQSVFVGEGHNDVDAIKLAGLSIAYPPKDSKVYSHADVSIHDDDLSKILEHVLVLDDRAPVSPRQTTKAPATIPASDNSERRVTWLHFSDLHICKLKTGWDSHRVLRTLAADLQQMQADHGLRPDFIFFTGDLAFGHLGNGPGQSITEQFDDGHAFLECARQAFHPHVPQENVFIVPGNHDVNRAECSVAITSWLDGIRDVQQITSFIQSASGDWRITMNRLADYAGFLKRNGYTHLLSDGDRLIYAATREIDGLKIGIAGLNSAWSCGRDDEKGKLWMGGDWQIAELTSRLESSDFRIALVHHPANWLKEYEDPNVWQFIERDFQFCLHGHEHQGWVKPIAGVGFTRIAAAATYENSKHENGYNFVRLDLQTGNADVWLRRYDASGGGWVPRVVFGRTDNDGKWPLTHLNWLKKLVVKPEEARQPSAPESRPEPQPENTQRIRPMMGGDSVSHVRGGAGTMGCLVRDRAAASRVYLLSDFNAICHPSDESFEGDAILQPGRSDGGTRATDLVAMLTRWTMVHDDASLADKNVSAAIALLRRPEDFSAKIRGRGLLKGVRAAKEEMSVSLVGRSGQALGRVVQVGAKQKVPIPLRQITGGLSSTGDGSGYFSVLFGDLIVCTEMIKAGDCGALLVDEENYAIGLAFASGPNESFFFPIQRVLDAMNVDLVTAELDDVPVADTGSQIAAPTPDSSNRPTVRDLVYVSYSHTDKEWHARLRKILDQDVRVPVWDDTFIPDGADWKREIQEHVPRARVMVMLVSSDYLLPACGAAELEIKPALEAARKGDLKILWIPVRAADFSAHPIGKLMAAHDPSQPLATLESVGQEKALQAVKERILGSLGLRSENEFKYDAFISYRRQEPDVSFAFDLVRKLESAGLCIALDERDFSPQATFLEEMERCVKESRFTLAVSSPRYFQSGNTQEEAIICKVLDMQDRKQRLIPLKMEATEMPYWLYGIVGIDFTGNQTFVDPLEKLKRTLGCPK